MLKKTLIALGLMAATTLSGCVVAVPPPGVVVGPAYPAYPAYCDSAAVVAPAPVPVPVPVPVPLFGFWGGWWHHGYYGHGYYGRGYYGHWR